MPKCVIIETPPELAGHVFGGEGSYANTLFREAGVDALDLYGSFSTLSLTRGRYSTAAM